MSWICEELGGLNKICVEFLVEQKNFSWLNKLVGVMYYVRKFFYCLVNHGHSVEKSWCGENFRVVFDILFGGKV